MNDEGGRAPCPESGERLHNLSRASWSQQLKLPEHQERRHPGYCHQTPAATKVTKAQRGEGTGTRSHSELVGELGVEPRTPDSAQSSFHPTRDPAMPDPDPGS